MPMKIIPTPETTLHSHLGQITLDLTQKTGVLSASPKGRGLSLFHVS